MTWKSRHRHHRYGPRFGPRDGSARFVRAMGCALAALILLSAIGASVIVAALLEAPKRGWTPTIIVAIVVPAIVIVGFVLTVMRVSRDFREQIRLRRQLMADVAHELRTPLAILQGRIEGLLDGVYPRDDAHLNELLAETQHLSRLVEDVRTIANADAGAMELRIERVDLAEIIRDVVAAVGVTVDQQVPQEIVIDADPVRIREVLLNLLTNAVQHAPEGRIAIHAETRSRDVLLRVTDDGPGISADELPHVFDRFHKGRASRGTGLGLSIAKKLVVAHGGDIRIESVEGAGTTVFVTLPL